MYEGGAVAGMKPTADSVFVSSTYEDLKSHRLAVKDVVEGLGLQFVGMEDFEADSRPPAEVICRKVRDSGCCLGILGTRYGNVDPVSGLSMTELEYSQAINSGKKVHMFVMADSARVPLWAMERAADKMAKLADFRERVMASNTCAKFVDAHDLARKVQHTLAQ